MANPTPSNMHLTPNKNIHRASCDVVTCSLCVLHLESRAAQTHTLLSIVCLTELTQVCCSGGNTLMAYQCSASCLSVLSQ